MTAISNLGQTQSNLLRALLHNRDGESIDGLSATLAISRNAVRQHLFALERDGLVTRGNLRPSRGRPLQAYVLSARGREQFSRQYNWLADLLMAEFTKDEKAPASAKMAALGASVSTQMRATLPGASATVERVQAVTDFLNELGYDAHMGNHDDTLEIRAYNCVFQDVAERHPATCAFDVAMIGGACGSTIDHASCIVQGAPCCRFVVKSAWRRTKAG